MIHLSTRREDPILQTHIPTLITLLKDLSINSFDNNTKSGFVWDTWKDVLERDDETIINDLYEDLLADQCTLYLLIEENELNGFALSRQWEEVMNIALLCVTKTQRGKGYGSRLMEGILKDAKEKECTNLTLSTEVNNTPALKLYTKFGLVPFSIDLGLQL